MGQQWVHEHEHDPFSPHVLVEEESPAGPDPSGPGGDEPPVSGAPPETAARRKVRRAKKEPAARQDAKLAQELAELEPPRAADDDE